jgi:hypothetical protein
MENIPQSTQQLTQTHMCKSAQDTFQFYGIPIHPWPSWVSWEKFVTSEMKFCHFFTIPLTVSLTIFNTALYERKVPRHPKKTKIKRPERVMSRVSAGKKESLSSTNGDRMNGQRNDKPVSFAEDRNTAGCKFCELWVISHRPSML